MQVRLWEDARAFFASSIFRGTVIWRTLTLSSLTAGIYVLVRARGKVLRAAGF